MPYISHKLGVPFYAQKWELSKYKELGFGSLMAARYWEKSSCGALCLKMAVDYFLRIKLKPLSPDIATHIKRGILLGAYNDKVGWDHVGLTRMAKEFGFVGIALENVSTAVLLRAVSKNMIPIISIKWAFKGSKTLKERIFFWQKKGGHLALVVGYKVRGDKLQGFFVHHTSLRQEYNWPNKYLSLARFSRGFTGRCVVISS